MTKIKAYVFDLDGTLINSGPDIVHAANVTRRAFMVPDLPYDDIIRFVGRGVGELMQGVMQDLAKEDWEDASSHFIKTYHDEIVVRTHLYDGIMDLLNVKRDSPMAVCTNKPQDMTHLILNHFGIDDYFDTVVGAQADFPLKPDPEGLLHICKTLKCKPSEVAMIGDSVVDMLTAQAAGCMAVAVSWGFQDAEDLKASAPDFLIHHPRELASL